ncbi:S10 family peptidase [Lichenicoccus roseus]|uniref:S10 family peptidase n=1 Tax=Lichenicoccus roseus TaxID=2683649 RepID=UPI0026D1A2E6
MRDSACRLAALLLATSVFVSSGCLVPAQARDNDPDPAQSADASGSHHDRDGHRSDRRPDLKATESLTDGSVTIGGARVDYQAAAGTLVVHPKGWDDTASLMHGQATGSDHDDDKGDDGKAGKDAEASMFYVAYFKKGARAENRPITFLYNGGPGSSSVWLHMGAFGPRRVITANDSHTDAAPYSLVDNDESLLDSTDLVFIDAPGTGFSRIAGPDKEKSFYGIDQDGHAFSKFIAAFLSKYGRWNSPKYLFGESYGTTRSAVLANDLENDEEIDLNGVILLSQILNFDASIDQPGFNPGVDLPYVVALPTFAATAWYHHKLPAGTSTELKPLLAEVQHFATTDYLEALAQGAALDPAAREHIAERLHAYTGLPVDYLKKSDLRVDGGQFEKMLQDDTGTTTGRLDSRFSGPSMDPLSKEADYDPQSASIGSAYVSVFNDYVRRTLKYGQDHYYKPDVAEIGKAWDMQHQPPGADDKQQSSANVMPDLATAMKYNPKLKIQLNAGYFDLATPYYEGVYEMQHLPIPASLQGNIEFRQYESGHMVYANQAALKQLHDNVADFIRRTDNQHATSP